jgi:PAS domain S-box-containing protein
MPFNAIDIHRAFEKDEFFPSFQPLVELRTGELTGFEVLARWQHGKLGSILPDDFISKVEACGEIDHLTQTILQKTFASLPLSSRSLMLSVNLSPVQLVDLTLPAKIEAAASRGGYSLDHLTVEVTESALLDDLPRAKRVAGDLKALHCRLALDDFGTGYSSLKHLQALPFDELKVDRSFVSSMAQTRESRKIVAAVIGLGQSLGLRTVAEGVETQEQANMLFSLGCDLGQGWLYGKPAPSQALARMIFEAPWTYSISMPAPLDESSITSLDALPAQRFAQLRAIYDGAPVGLCFLNRDLRYVSLNRQLAQMNGVPAAAHLGKTPAEIVPLIYPRIAPYMQRALQGEPVIGVEVQKPTIAEGGDGRTLLISYQPVRDEGGEVLGISVAIMDITRHKQAEQALGASEAHYRSMLELSPHIPWVLDANGELVEASSRWESLTGMTLEQAQGDGWLRALHPDDLAPTVNAIKASLATGKPIDLEYRVRRPGQEWRWMHSRGSARYGPSGEVIRIYGSAEDIDEHKRTVEALLRSQTALTAAFDATPAGMILASAPGGEIVMANPEASRIFDDKIHPGQKIADYGQWGALDVNLQPLPPEEYPLARAILRGEAQPACQGLCSRSSGTPVRLRWLARPILDTDGRTIGAVMVVRDLDAPE